MPSSREIVATAGADIDAPLELVWRVVLDLRAYAAWNPFIVRATSVPETLRVGSRFDLHVRWFDGGGAASREVVTAIEPPSAHGALLEYRYGSLLHALGLVRAVRSQQLTRAGAGTRYATREQFHGLLARAVPLGRVQEGFERHARALKARCEALART